MSWSGDYLLVFSISDSCGEDVFNLLAEAKEFHLIEYYVLRKTL